MGHEMCGHCNAVPCECDRRDRVVPVAVIIGNDDEAIVVPKRKGIAADPVTGQGCVRRLPTPSLPGHRDKTEEWDMGEPICRLPGDADEPFMPTLGRDVGEEIVTSKNKLSVKDTNPKDAVGTKKWRQYCTVPTTIIWELGVAMLEGARKYGRHNYRVSGVRGSVYVDAAKGHIDQWWEGEDIDEESGLSHITKAMASLCVLRDAMIQGKFVDDRPPKTNLNKLRDTLQAAVESIFERHPEAKAAYLEGDQNEINS